MASSPLSAPELRLSRFCRAFAVVYLLGGGLFAVAPGLVFRIASFGDVAGFPPEARFWWPLAVAGMAAVGVACAVTAGRPRERRHALLPAIAAKLVAGSLALAQVASVAGGTRRALLSLAISDLVLFVATLWIYRTAAPGVHSAPARPAPAEPAATPVQLGVSRG